MQTITANLHNAAVDRLLDFYCAWREECAQVHTTYVRLSSASRPDRTLAFAAYIAALDREAAAARMYLEQVNRVSSWIASADEAASTPSSQA
jgi:hypothetical protein